MTIGTREQTRSEARIRKAAATMPGVIGFSFGDGEPSPDKIADYLEVVRDQMVEFTNRLTKVEQENTVYRNIFRSLQQFFALVQLGGLQ